MVDQAAPEAVKLPDPNDPRYAAARAKMANLFFAIGREDSRNGYGAMADDLMCGDLMQVPTWIALGMLAEAASHPCKSGEGAVVNPLVEALVYLNTLEPTRIMDDRGNPGLSYTGQQIVNAYKAGFAAAPRTDATQTREAELVERLVTVATLLKWFQDHEHAEVSDAKEAWDELSEVLAALNARGGA